MESHLDIPYQAPSGERRTVAGEPLDGVSARGWHDVVTLDQLSPLDRIVATTRNHTYEIVVGSADDQTVLVRGGTAFPEFISAHLLGSSLGGGKLKVGTVAVGLRLELATHTGRWLITTPVQAIAVVPTTVTQRDDEGC